MIKGGQSYDGPDRQGRPSGTDPGRLPFRQVQDKENHHEERLVDAGGDGDRSGVFFTPSLADDEPRARKMMEEAFNRRYRWSENFKGFSADSALTREGKTVKGSVKVLMPPKSSPLGRHRAMHARGKSEKAGD